MEIIEVSTFIHPKIYNRMPNIKTRVDDMLMAEAILRAGGSDKLDTATAEYKTELLSESTRKCEDRLKVSLSIHSRWIYNKKKTKIN